MTAKQKAMQIASNLGIEIEIEYDLYDTRKIDRIMGYAPEGYWWWDGCHDRVCAMQPDWVYDKNGKNPIPATPAKAEELWTWVIEELKTPIEKCPSDCSCLE